MFGIFFLIAQYLQLVLGLSPLDAGLWSGALGIALLGSIGTAVYRSQLTQGLPAGLGPHAAETARATLGGAVQVSQRLPDHLGTPLVDTARAAFTHGLHVTAIVSAAVAIALAILAATVLRSPQPVQEPETDVSQTDPLRMRAHVEPCGG